MLIEHKEERKTPSGSTIRRRIMRYHDGQTHEEWICVKCLSILVAEECAHCPQKAVVDHRKIEAPSADLMTAREASLFLGHHQFSRVYSLIAQERLETRRIDGHTFLTKKSVTRYLKTRRVTKRS